MSIDRATENNNNTSNATSATTANTVDPTSSGGSGERIEWSRATILGFIEDYRQERVLWDPSTKGYHIKQIKYEALKQLSFKYGTEIRSIRSKIKSLRSSFHREHGKVINGKRNGVHYQPMWFAYEAIRFILDVEQPHQQPQQQLSAQSHHHQCKSEEDELTAASAEAANAGVGAIGVDFIGKGGEAKGVFGCCYQQALTQLEADDQDEVVNNFGHISADDVKTEIIENDSNESEIHGKSAATNGEKSNLKIKSQKRSQNEADDEDQSQSKMFHLSASNNKSNPPQPRTTATLKCSSDEYGIFGEYVGITIRKLKTSKAKVVVKHLINNLLYEAEIGKYDQGIPASKEPPHLYQT